MAEWVTNPFNPKFNSTTRYNSEQNIGVNMKIILNTSNQNNYVFGQLDGCLETDIFTDRIRSTRGGNIFSLSVSSHPGGYLLRSGWGEYLLKSGWGGPGPARGKGVPWLGGRGGTLAVGEGGGGTLARGGRGYLGRYPCPSPEHSMDWLCRGQYASCVLAQEDFLVVHY